MKRLRKHVVWVKKNLNNEFLVSLQKKKELLILICMAECKIKIH